MHIVQAKTILSANNGLNIYRGCTHGCIYCDSRSNCYQMDHDFEDVAVKINAPQLLEAVFRRKREKCMIGTGSMSDPYNGLEEELRLTRQCLELINLYGFGVTVLTKSTRILRDLDLLSEINQKTKCVVQMTLTTCDQELVKILEPKVSTTEERFQVLKTLAERRIPTVVWLSPILPYLNDSAANIRGILDYCLEAKVKGIVCFNMGLTLRKGNREYFYQKLDQHFPGLKERYINKYGDRCEVISPRNAQLMQLFRDTCQAMGLIHEVDQCFQYLRTFEQKRPKQLMLPGLNIPARR